LILYNIINTINYHFNHIYFNFSISYFMSVLVRSKLICYNAKPLVYCFTLFLTLKKKILWKTKRANVDYLTHTRSTDGPKRVWRKVNCTRFPMALSTNYFSTRDRLAVRLHLAFRSPSVLSYGPFHMNQPEQRHQKSIVTIHAFKSASMFCCLR